MISALFLIPAFLAGGIIGALLVMLMVAVGRDKE